MLFKVLALFSTVAVISGMPQNRYQAPQQQSYQAPVQQGYQGNLQGAAQTFVPNQQSQPGMPYNFNWAVQAPEFGNDYSHTQQSDGTTTTGEYRTLLPDGRTQIVRFTANADGYVADVTYEGEARYDQASSNRRPTYSAPAPAPIPQQQSYQAPTQTYQQPSSTYGAGRR